MLDYVINLLDDSTDFSWASAKASHVVLLCHMEQGEITGWHDTKKIDRVRRAVAQCHSVGQSSTLRGQDKGSHGEKLSPVCTFIRECASRSKQRTKVSLIGSFALTVGIKSLRFSNIPNWNVGMHRILPK